MKSLTITAPTLILALASTSFSLDSTAKPRWAPVVGANGYLSRQAKAKIYGAADLACYQDLMLALNSGRRPGVKALIESDRVVSLAAGTPIQVVRTHPGSTVAGEPPAAQVLILGGELADRKAWVPADWIVEKSKRDQSKNKKDPAKGGTEAVKAG